MIVWEFFLCTTGTRVGPQRAPCVSALIALHLTIASLCNTLRCHKALVIATTVHVISADKETPFLRARAFHRYLRIPNHRVSL